MFAQKPEKGSVGAVGSACLLRRKPAEAVEKQEVEKEDQNDGHADKPPEEPPLPPPPEETDFGAS